MRQGLTILGVDPPGLEFGLLTGLIVDSDNCWLLPVGMGEAEATEAHTCTRAGFDFVVAKFVDEVVDCAGAIAVGGMCYRLPSAIEQGLSCVSVRHSLFEGLGDSLSYGDRGHKERCDRGCGSYTEAFLHDFAWLFCINIDISTPRSPDWKERVQNRG